jgi:hypothetical protein
MDRVRLLLVGASLALAAAFPVIVGAGPEDRGATEKVIADKLAVQTALLQGRDHLRDGQPAKAVAVLEAQLPRIDGSRVYLTTLREAYRSYVTELFLHHQEEPARKYLERLRILDPAAAAALDPKTNAISPTRAAPAPATTALELPLPGPAPLAAKDQAPAGPPYVSPLTPAGLALPRPKVFRGARPDDAALADDPFGKAHELPAEPRHAGANTRLARELLARAQEEFNNSRFSKARLLFDQANQADPAATTGSRDLWAYCKLNHVVEELNRGGEVPLTDLEQETQAALSLSSAPKLTSFGRSLLEQIARRRQGGANDGAVRHYADGRSGWQVAESAHFRVFHRQSRELAEQVAGVAERTRRTMFRKWFNSDGPDWQPKCDLYLHATGSEYSRLTGVPASSPGHSRIETDPSTGRIVSRRMDLRCDNPTMLQAVLPHETTHVVLAGQLGKGPVPRWVDEGIAVLSEPTEKVSQHLQNLARASRQRDLFSVRELMRLDDYPTAQRITTFYAESVSLVAFLSRQKGPEVFSRFVRDSQREGYESALRRYYGFRDYADLESRWSQDALDIRSAAVAER